MLEHRAVFDFYSKLNWRIMAWVWIMFASLDLVRRNINRAISDNMVRRFIRSTFGTMKLMSIA